MFVQLDRLPDDPILGLSARFRADPSPRKVDLTVGVYKDEAGNVPVMRAVREAERRYIEAQTTKAYIGIAGDAGFLAGMERLVFGWEMLQAHGARIASVQTPGGCAALYAAAMLIRQSSPDARIWVSDPTWSNHVPLFTAVGVPVSVYPYCLPGSPAVAFDAMLAALAAARAGDVVLLHGSCHNPTGMDLDAAQGSALLDLIAARGLVPLVDLAYQGFGDGLEEDVAALRTLAARVPEALFTVSCSKNFGLYRDRIGMLSVLAVSESAAAAAHSHVLKIARCSYSMPPAHGAGVVNAVLSSPDLMADWRSELDAMRARITTMRLRLADALSRRGVADTAHLHVGRGMFSVLPLAPHQVERLRGSHGVHLVDSGRINLCGLTEANLEVVADALSAVWRVSA